MNYIYTDLSTKDAVVLVIGQPQLTVTYQISQFSATFAANEVPTAVCLLAVGRDTKSPGAATPAAINQYSSFPQMTPAQVFFTPKGDYDKNKPWPPGLQIIFDGFLTGFAYKKLMGKIQIVANLIHWSAALGFSSSLTVAGHPSNPSQLNAAAVLSTINEAGGSNPPGPLGYYLSHLAPAAIVQANVGKDLWQSVKTMLCAFASVLVTSVGPPLSCEGSSPNPQINTAALSALKRIEGLIYTPDIGKLSLAYDSGVPLVINTEGVPTVLDAVANAIGHQFIESWSSYTFWDKLIGQYCPAFGMAFVPMVETAVIIADTPGYNANFWKVIDTDEYDSFDMSSELTKPLRGIGVLVNFDSQTRAGLESSLTSGTIIGGCYVEDSVQPGDGAILYINSPAWLLNLKSTFNWAAYSTGVGINKPSSSSTNPGMGILPNSTLPDKFALNANILYNNFAHDVYVKNMLRGRMGSISGKLRFDIAPCSIVQINASVEKHLGAEDSLAATLYACVQRVTIAINAESGLAGTTFALSHIRTATENTSPRTSVSFHPLFGTSIYGGGKHGSPLIKVYNI